MDVTNMQAEATRYDFGNGGLLYQIWYDWSRTRPALMVTSM